MDKTEIAFLSGFDPICRVPMMVRAAGLTHRFAVIQETHKPGSADMVFDEELYLALIRLATEWTADGRVMAEEYPGAAEQGIEAYLGKWGAQPAGDRSPDAMILVHTRGELAVCVFPEHWARVGGPMPYHDSYTYSVFAKEDPGPRVMAYLAECASAAGWRLADKVMSVPNRGPGWIRMLKGLLS